MNLEIPYIRVGTSYFKIIEKPLISGDKVKIMVRWNRETIITDHGKTFLEEILKLDGFCCIPNHIDYNLIDPKDAVNKNPSIMVAALDKRIVSFLKVQERDILKPLRQDVFNYQNLQKIETTKLIDSLNKFLNFHNEKLIEIKKTEAENNIEIKRFYKENFNVLLAEQQKNRQAILTICQLIDEKNNSGTIDKLKSLFS